jgi:hypothetical protein
MVKLLPADWRIHPIYFVGVGFLFGLWFDYTWLAPARLGDYRLEIADARNVVTKAKAEATTQSNRADVAERKVAELENAVLAAERNARDALTANTFVAGSPYPIGMGSIRLGASIEQIEREVPPERLEKKKGFLWIKMAGSVFDRVSLHWDDRAKNPVVSQLGFWASEDASKDKEFLRQKLTHALGSPTEPQGGYCEWHLSDGTGIFISPREYDWQASNYQIIGRGYQPGDWPSPTATGSIKR